MISIRPRELKPDIPIGYIGVLKQWGRYFVGWRMSENFWIRMGVRNGEPDRFSQIQIPIRDDAQFPPPDRARRAVEKLLQRRSARTIKSILRAID